MKSLIGKSGLAFALLFFSHLAAAAPFTEASVSTISPCPSFCGGFGGAFDFDSDGGAGAVFAEASLNNTDGNGRAQAEFVGADLLPELKADAFSNTSPRTSRVGSTATGMQQYIYSGAGGPVTMSATFDGVLSGEADIDGRLVVMSGVDPGEPTDYATLIFEIIPLTPGLEELGRDDANLSATGMDDLAVSFNPVDGDSIFIWAQLAVSGIRGGSADAFSTMTLEFSDPTGFTPQLGDISPIPVPAAFWLFGTALAGFVGMSRRRKVA